MPTYVVRVARQATVFLLFLLTIVLGAVSGVLFAFAGDLPQISALDDYAPSTITRIYAGNGDVIGEFAKERRLVVDYEGISPLLRQAIIAAEDKDFEEHVGLSLPRIVITAVKDVIHQQRAGASTITQQVARMLFLQSDYMRGGVYARTGVAGWERKIKEAIISVQLEKRYTKREIFTLFCNATYFGHGAYGVEAASRLYFGKSAKDLALEEAALIAGIIQGNVRQSPYINPEAATRRRNYALQRMADEGFITPARASAAKAAPIKTAGLPTQPYSPAPYFVEDVRQQLEARFGAKQLYENGLSVQTSLDLPLQQAATRALQAGLRRLDQRRGFRKPTNLLAAGADLDAYRHPRWQAPMAVDDVGMDLDRLAGLPAPPPPRSRRAPAASTSGFRKPAMPGPARRTPRRWSPAARWCRCCSSRSTDTARPAASIRNPNCRAASSRSTTGPAACSRWSAASTSIAASSIAPCRPSDSSGRRSSWWSTPPPSIAATPPPVRCSTRRCPSPAGPARRPMRR